MHQVREPPDQIERRVRVLREHELDVGLVEDHQHVRRNLLEEGGDPLRRDVRAGRVVRVADEQHAGVVGDGRRHRVQVVRVIARSSGTSTALASVAAARCGYIENDGQA